MPLGEGSVLGRRYRLLSQIGRGGMGTVWHAHDDLLARDVAVKEVLFPPGLTDDEHKVMYERTLREARSAARLNHPGIVTVHDVVEEDGRPCIVMEFVRARSLQEVLDQEDRLPPIQVAEIGAQVLAALRTAHAAGITHRDVKPANVLLAGDAAEPISRSTRVVITDFGIATMEGDSTLTQTGLIMGSPAYIAPERARGDKASPASDLWALGATLYAAVEGRSPHHRSEAMAALTSIISEEAPPPRHAGPLAPVLMGLLVKDPATRLTAEQVAEGLTRAAHSTRPLPAPDPAAMAGNGQGTALGHERPGGRRLTAEPAPPYEPSAAVTAPGAGSRAYGPTPAREPVPSGAGRPDPGGPSADPRGAGAVSNAAGAVSNAAGGSQDESWMRTYDRPTGGPATVGTGQNGPRAKAVVLSLGAVLVAAGLALALFLHFSKKNDDPSHEKPQTSGASPSSTPSSTPSTKASPTPPAVPKGYHEVTAQDGARLVVPKGWVHKINSPQSELWIDSRTGSHVQLDTIPWGTADPVKHWMKWGEDAPKNLPGFQWVDPPNYETERGWKAGDAEYSWDSGSHGKLYAFDRGFTANGTQYSLMAADKDRSVANGYFGKAFTSFQPGRR
ncbi:protein kinase [Actinoallomurus purpureus]|uniref:serine/threonine-protein kinase n=1 Tax=Actinoallomurus purpureus TaxID=478114 RepID=UPI002093BA9A|nr:serine/threonine-protein kinase [Actinoallomurus purpureus]MCO6006067.1 protein kinase [Actinoallomurus purpureus]